VVCIVYEIRRLNVTERLNIVTDIWDERKDAQELETVSEDDKKNLLNRLANFRANPNSAGEEGKPGAGFDGLWDQSENFPESESQEAPGRQHLEAREPGMEFRTHSEKAENDNLPDAGRSHELVDAAVKGYNEEIARDSAGGEYRDVQRENLQRKSPEEVAEARRQFAKEKGELINQWENANNREWPRYEEDVTTKNGKVIRKVGDKFDAHHVQPLELGGQNTVDNVTPMHAKDHHDKQGIHRPGGAYDNMVKTVKEA